MSITSIMENRHRERGFRESGAWRVAWVVDNEGSALMDDVFQLWHYTTCMLEWHESEMGTTLMHTDTGRGSVSDQNGVNKALNVLGVPMRYRRDQRGGGARITTR